MSARASRRASGAQLIQREWVFRGRAISVRSDRIVMPNGEPTVREVIEYPRSVAIVPVPEPGWVILIRQYRYCAGQYLWEIPAGTLERGEAPVSAARRELREETGQTAARLTLMADLFTSPGVLTERMRLYVATNLTPAPLEPDRDECIRVYRFRVSRALEMVSKRRIRDGKSLLGLALLAQLHPDLAAL